MPCFSCKWQQSNLGAITSIYLFCIPGLKGDWLSSCDVKGEVEEIIFRRYVSAYTLRPPSNIIKMYRTTESLFLRHGEGLLTEGGSQEVVEGDTRGLEGWGDRVSFFLVFFSNLASHEIHPSSLPSSFLLSLLG